MNIVDMHGTFDSAQAELVGGAAATGDYTALERLSAELSELLQRIEHGEERWLELSDLAG